MPTAVPSKKKLYEVLGVEEGASEDAIRVAYKKLALKWHPDRHQDDKETAQEKFIEIKDAYTALVEGRKGAKKSKKTPPQTPPSTTPSTTSSSSASSKSSSSSASSKPASTGTVPSSAKSDTSSTKSHRSSKSAEQKPCATQGSTRKPAEETKSPPRSPPTPHNSDPKTPKPSPRRKPTAPPFARSDSDTSSDEDDNIHYHDRKNHKDHYDNHSTAARKNRRPGEDDGYEFLDFGSPLQPLRASNTIKGSGPGSGSVKSGKSGDFSKEWVFPLKLSLEDLYHGAVHHYRVIRNLRSGKTQTVKLDVNVLPGWQNGTRIRVPNVGNERKDGTFQDIVFVVEAMPHPQFKRVDNDIYVTVQVPWADSRSRPYSSSSLGSRLAGDPDPLRDDSAFVKGLDGEEYGLPIPVSLVEAADGSRIMGAGMPIREKGEVVGKGDLVIRWEFIFPENEKIQESRWQSLKKMALGWKL